MSGVGVEGDSRAAPVRGPRRFSNLPWGCGAENSTRKSSRFCVRNPHPQVIGQGVDHPMTRPVQPARVSYEIAREICRPHSRVQKEMILSAGLRGLWVRIGGRCQTPCARTVDWPFSCKVPVQSKVHGPPPSIPSQFAASFRDHMRAARGRPRPPAMYMPGRRPHVFISSKSPEWIEASYSLALVCAPERRIGHVGPALSLLFVEPAPMPERHGPGEGRMNVAKRCFLRLCLWSIIVQRHRRKAHYDVDTLCPPPLR